MADIVRAQVTIPRDNGVPADAITNTFHFASTIFTGVGTQTVVDALDEFYNEVVANNYSPGMFLSENLNGANARVKIYSLDDGEPVGAPLADEPLPITVSTGDALPDEVAVCLSYQAAVAQGQKQSRRRGRIYLGPLGVVASSQSGNYVVIDSFTGQLLADAGARLINRDMGGVKWVVFSAKDYTDSNGVVHHKKPPQAADAWYEVDNVWVDNAFDTQRSRGPKATARYVAS